MDTFLYVMLLICILALIAMIGDAVYCSWRSRHHLRNRKNGTDSVRR
jgi:hypothetical protein